MSVCTFIASDSPLREVTPQKGYPFCDGEADDGFFLRAFKDVQVYTDKKYGVVLGWFPTDGGAKKLLEYIENALEYKSTIEIWHVWLMDYCEYYERPVIQKCTVPFSELTIEDIKEIDCVNVWNTPDRQNPRRPSFYCLKIEGGNPFST